MGDPEMKMHTAPNPGPPVGKPHDVSFDKEKTLMRTISTEGEGEEAREGSVVVVHVDIAQPDSEGKLKRMYCSRDTYPDGVRFELGRSFYSGAHAPAGAGANGTFEGCCCTTEPLQRPRAPPATTDRALSPLRSTSRFARVRRGTRALPLLLQAWLSD